MEPPSHSHHGLASQVPKDELAAMALHRRDRKMGNVAVGYFHGIRDFIGQPIQACAQDEPVAGGYILFALQVGNCFLDVIVQFGLSHVSFGFLYE
jgi:hypothetical protein